MNAETIGLGVICAALVAILSRVILHLLKTNGNCLQHIQDSIDALPCKTPGACPVEGEE